MEIGPCFAQMSVKDFKIYGVTHLKSSTSSMKLKEKLVVSSRRKTCGFQSWNHKWRLEHHTCCTRMLVIARAINKILERFVLQTCVLKSWNIQVQMRLLFVI